MPLPQTTSELIQGYYDQLQPDTQHLLDIAIERLVEQKKKGGKVMVITGSGPNLHEGVTTLIAELMDKGIVDVLLLVCPLNLFQKVIFLNLQSCLKTC
jgi:hypothetical protein